MALYDVVLDGVRAAHGLAPGDEAGLAVHLGGLAPALHRLRESYRTGRGTVAVEYTEAVTEAYLLAYYPHYVRMAWRVLRLLPRDALPDTPTLRVCIFGVGPAPEPVAIAGFLGAHAPAVAAMELNLFDIDPAAWQATRAISLDRVLPAFWNGQVDVAAVRNLDVTSPGLVFGPVEEAVMAADLVVFQNCLNEFADEAHVSENVQALVAVMRAGAVLTMADIANYPNARRCLEAVEQAVDPDVDWLHRPGVELLLPPMNGVPAIVRANLFVLPEYPRRNPFSWRCLAARVRV